MQQFCFINRLICFSDITCVCRLQHSTSTRVSMFSSFTLSALLRCPPPLSPPLSLCPLTLSPCLSALFTVPLSFCPFTLSPPPSVPLPLLRCPPCLSALLHCPPLLFYAGLPFYAVPLLLFYTVLLPLCLFTLSPPCFSAFFLG